MPVQFFQALGIIPPGRNKNQVKILPSQLGGGILPDGCFAFLQGPSILINQVFLIPDKNAGLLVLLQQPEKFRILLVELVRKHAQKQVILEGLKLFQKMLPGKSRRTVARQVDKGHIPVLHKKRLPGSIRFHPHRGRLVAANGVDQAGFPRSRLAKQHNGHIFPVQFLNFFLNPFCVLGHASPIWISASSRCWA